MYLGELTHKGVNKGHERGHGASWQEEPESRPCWSKSAAGLHSVLGPPLKVSECRVGSVPAPTIEPQRGSVRLTSDGGLCKQPPGSCPPVSPADSTL